MIKPGSRSSVVRVVSTSLLFACACTEPSATDGIALDPTSSDRDAAVRTEASPACPEIAPTIEPLVVKQELIYDARLLPSESGAQILDVRLYAEGQSQAPAIVVDISEVGTKKVLASRLTGAVAKTFTVVTTDGFQFVDEWKGEASAALLLPGAAKPISFALAPLAPGKATSVAQGSLLRLRLTSTSNGDKKGLEALTADPWLGAVGGGSFSLQTPGKSLVEPASVPVSVTGRWFEWTLPFPTTTAEKVGVRIRAIDASGKDVDGVDWEIAARLGSGTRTSAGQASNKAELL